MYRYANGVKILFRPTAPRGGGYLSAAEEKALERAEEEEQQGSSGGGGGGGGSSQGGKFKMGAYVPPEQAARMKREEEAAAAAAAAAAQIGSSSSSVKSKKRAKPEGGLEIVIDSEPYRRVRVRRCNYPPEEYSPVVKEESEAAILKALQQGIRNVEAFYEKMLTEGLEM
jgi:hypothetical protein